MYHVNLLKKWHPSTATLLAVNKDGQTEAEYAEGWEEEEAAEWADSNAGVIDDFYPLGDQPAQDIHGCATELPPALFSPSSSVSTGSSKPSDVWEDSHTHSPHAP